MQAPRNYGWRDYDAAHRMRDGIAVHHMALSTAEILAGRYVTIRLSDGSVSGTAYDTRAEALRYAPGLESLYAYWRITPERLSAQACDVLLWYVRTAYTNGYRPDPDRPDLELIIPGRIDDIHSDLRGRHRPGV